MDVGHWIFRLVSVTYITLDYILGPRVISNAVTREDTDLHYNVLIMLHVF